MRLLRRIPGLLWATIKGTARHLVLYVIPPAVAAVALIYISSQVFGFDVESRHSSWIDENGNTHDGWLIFTPGQEGVRWETRDRDGCRVAAGRALLPVGSFLSPSTIMDHVGETEEFTFFPNGTLESHILVEDVSGDETSECFFFNESGQKLVVARRVNSLPDGVFRKWYANGRLMFEQKFENGLPEGIGRVWNQDGVLIGEAHSKGGFAHNGVFPRHDGATIDHLTVWREGQQVEEVGFSPDMPPIPWHIPECSGSRATPDHTFHEMQIR